MEKNDKTSKIDKSDLEQKTRALLENMGSDIKRIAEAQTATADKVTKIETLTTRLPALESAVNTISMAVMQISSDVKDLKNKVDENLLNHEKRITKLEEKVLI